MDGCYIELVFRYWTEYSKIVRGRERPPRKKRREGKALVSVLTTQNDKDIEVAKLSSVKRSGLETGEVDFVYSRQTFSEGIA